MLEFSLSQVQVKKQQPRADTFTCSGLMPHAFYKSGTWLLDYVLKSPWPNGQGVGPQIQRLWVQVPLGMLAHLTHRSSSSSQTGASSTCCLQRQSGAVAGVLGS